MAISYNQTLLTKDNTIDLFGTAVGLFEDYSLSALMRAIVVKNEPNLKGSDLQKAVGMSYLRAHSAEDIPELIKEYPNGLHVVRFESNSSLDDVFKTLGYVSSQDNNIVKAVEMYLTQFIRTRIYLNESEKRLSIIVNKQIDVKYIRQLLSVLCKLLPWYFGESLSEEEVGFFKSLSGPDINKADSILIEYVNKIAIEWGIRERIIASTLNGYGDILRNDRIQTVQSLYADCADRIRRYNRNLADEYVNFDALATELNALRLAPQKGDEEIISFFINHTNISIVDTSHAVITYDVTDTLEYYNFEECVKLFDNKHSWLNNAYAPEFLKVAREIFVNKRGIIKVAGEFSLTDMKLVQPQRGSLCNNFGVMPNPHVYYYGCSGGNDKYYHQFAESGEWDLGIEQSISAAKNWNVGDSSAGSRMFSWLYSNQNMPCIYYKNGEEVSDINNAEIISFEEFSKRMEERWSSNNG